ncbi:L,D-transpeptidase family protein [Streptomyces sp. NPDC002851]
MHISGTVRSALAAAVCLAALTSCGLAGGGSSGGSDRARADNRPAAPTRTERPTTDPRRLPGVGDRLHSRIPDKTRQAVLVTGEGPDSGESELALYTQRDGRWHRDRAWPAHNGKKGWTTDHREGDKRTPVGVFTLSDAGGVLPDPGTRLPYTESPAFQASRTWPKAYWDDFDLIIAIDYNRAKGTPPNDPTRPLGQSKGGYIWLHLDHGSGTSGCVSIPKPAMEYLLKRLDPQQHPVIVMGDKDHLAAT